MLKSANNMLYRLIYKLFNLCPLFSTNPQILWSLMRVRLLAAELGVEEDGMLDCVARELVLNGKRVGYIALP